MGTQEDLEFLFYLRLTPLDAVLLMGTESLANKLAFGGTLAEIALF
jgi:hypothetical protein